MELGSQLDNRICLIPSAQAPGRPAYCSLIAVIGNIPLDCKEYLKESGQ